MKTVKFGGIFFLVVVICVALGFLKMISPFLQAIVLAAVIAGLFYPLFRKANDRLWQRPSFWAGVFTVKVLILFIVPIIFVCGLLVTQTMEFQSTVTSVIEGSVDKVPGLLKKYQDQPLVQAVIQRVDIETLDWQSKVAEVAQAASGWLVKIIQSTTQGVAGTAFFIFVMLFSFYYFLIEGPEWLKEIKLLSPLKDDYEDQIIEKFTSVTKASLKSVLVIGATQGTLGGITFALCGVGSPVFWGTIMMVISIIPVIGATIIWLPAAIINIVSGNIGAGIGILVGGFVIMCSDNIMRPHLIGKDAKLHPLLVLFATVGGLTMFGVYGIIFGPILASICVTIKEIYKIEFADYLNHVNLGQPEPEGGQESEG